MDHENKLDWLQSLRGVAVMLVVFTHARNFLIGTDQFALAETLFRPGAMGVDLFFIISGFIMVYTSSRSDGSLAYTINFAIKRFSRIWPPYAVLTLIFVAAAYSFNYYTAPDNWTILAKSLAMIPADPAKPLYFGLALPLGWTLEFEVYFYLVFGICLLFKRLRWAVLTAWILLTVVAVPYSRRGLALDVMDNLQFNLGYLNLMTNPIVLEFLAGALIALLYQNKQLRVKNATVCWHLIALAIAFPLWYAYTGVGDFHGPLKWGWPLAAMFLVLAICSKTVHIVPPRILVWLGAISFSLYLTHTTTQTLVTRCLIDLNLDRFIHSWGHVFLTTVVAVSVAALSHHYLERGLSDATRDWLLRLYHRTRQARPDGDALPGKPV
ncbi:acyltransferase family protein [Duganella violaceipulchra]|uniref:Acyltransferase n=1 Tax=Duganella violaceipulchra TaxID=2849652 RepID=A0AA41L9G5_9BURK|nr:acyltransferase [Duganella violaceicalia]MBV6323230.1 acyltransferase [Duganella violaceicalia]MCP2009982.1 peptidoglycan/LPS O-acetylase OafA/YrhL [Duganella violaceicalia]